MWGTKIFSLKLANTHFWLGTLGIIFYALPLYWAGIVQSNGRPIRFAKQHDRLADDGSLEQGFFYLIAPGRDIPGIAEKGFAHQGYSLGY